MITLKRSYLLSIIAAGIIVAVADYRNSLKLTQIKCKTGDAYIDAIKNFTCSVKSLNRLRAAINAEAFLLKPLDDVLVNFQIFKKNTVRYLPFIVNVTIAGCEYMAGRDNPSFYAKFIIGWIRKYSNFNHSCPYSGRVFLNNLEPFADKIPVFVPEGDYRMDITLYERNFENMIATINGYGTISNRPLLNTN